MIRQRGLLRHLRALRHNRRGSAAMEFAIVAPILIVCLVFTFDLGNALQQRIRLADAVRAGGLFALYYPTDPSTNGASVNATAIAAAVTNAVSDWNNLSTPTVTMACYCWNRSANDTTFASSPACSSATSATCGSSAELRRYITISASRPFRPIIMTGISTIQFSHVVRFQ